MRRWLLLMVIAGFLGFYAKASGKGNNQPDNVKKMEVMMAQYFIQRLPCFYNLIINHQSDLGVTRNQIIKIERTFNKSKKLIFNKMIPELKKLMKQTTDDIIFKKLSREEQKKLLQKVAEKKIEISLAQIKCNDNIFKLLNEKQQKKLLKILAIETD